MFACWRRLYNHAVISTVRVALSILIVSTASVSLPRTASAQTGSSRAVLVTATDAGNRPLANLGEDDFVVREAGEPREVFAVHLADYPLVLLLDNGDGAGDFESVRQAAARFIARIGRDRPVAIAALADPAAMITTFDDDRATVMAAIAGLKPGGPSGAGFLQAIAKAAAMIRATQAPFSAVVVISATDPNTRSEAPVELVAPIIDSRTAVHVIARTPAASARGAVGTLGDTLRLISDQTRGQFTAIYSAASYAPALDRLADRLSAEMMVEFIEPPGAVPSDDVKVGVRVPGAQVRGLGVSR